MRLIIFFIIKSFDLSRVALLQVCPNYLLLYEIAYLGSQPKWAFLMA